MHGTHRAQNFRSSTSAQRKTDRQRNPQQNYFTDPANFRHKELVKRNESNCFELYSYIPGSGNKTTALLLIGLIMSGFIIDTVNATSSGRLNRSDRRLRDKTDSEKFTRDVCRHTNIKPANKAEGAWIRARLDATTNNYHFAAAYSDPISREAHNQLQKEYKVREKIFHDNDSRGRTFINQRITYNKMLENCEQFAETPLTNSVDINIVNHVINDKLFLYQLVEEAYSSTEAGVLGNCHEITAQACLLLLPELIPNEEFFLKIVTKTKDLKSAHVYGIIVPKNLLMGEGLASDEERKNFGRKFTRPFFNRGDALIKMGKNDDERATNTALFWKALGIANGKVESEEVSSQAKLCDPYMGDGLYCHGLENCFDDKEIAQTYLMAFETITEIGILSWGIPEELHSKIDNFDYVNCLNEKINQDILSLINNKIKPAAIKKHESARNNEL